MLHSGRTPQGSPVATLIAWVIAVALVATGCAAHVPASSSDGDGSSAMPNSSASVAAPVPQSDDQPVGEREPWIAFQWIAGSGDGIFLVRPDGTGMHQMVSDMTGSEIHPDWSPDGSQITFVRQTPEGPTELWIVGADGTGAERLYTCEPPCNEIHFPDWPPGGDSIYFSQNGDVPSGGGIPQTFSFHRFDLGEGAATTVYGREDGVDAWQARVSPDGTLLAYAAGSEELGAAIFTVPIDGGPETRLTEWELLAAYADWTSDGRIVFPTHDLAISPSLTEPANAFIIGADGRNIEQLTHFTESGVRAAQTRVSPDGAGVTFTHVEGPSFGTRRLACLEIGTPEPRWLADVPVPGTHPHLRPTGEDG